METKNIPTKKVFFAKLKTTLKNIQKDSNPVVHALMEDVQKYEIQPAGPLEYLYFGATEDMDKEFDLEIALPVVKEAKPEWSQFSFKDLEEFKCATHLFKGSMDKMYGAYETAFAGLGKASLQPTDQVREVYQKWEGYTSNENVIEIQLGVQ